MQVAILGQKATSEGKDRQGGKEGKEGGKRERESEGEAAHQNPP
jgi:hypothetical protein